ncbi:MAG: DUF362 domain-containing protein [Myxococcota bacterium]|nr:DUF362 domain-containing protein [Myxococcota bacterium]
MTQELDRRGFIKRISACSAGIIGATSIGLIARDRGRDEPLPLKRTLQVRDFKSGLDAVPPRLVIGRGDPAVATRAAIDAMGGMSRFVRPGESVVIKPNVGWDRIPIQAANTHPTVVATLVGLCYEAKASRVIVTDNPCNDARRCFTRSGIWKAVEGVGGEVVLPAAHRFRPYDLGGVILRQMPVLVPAVDADRLINVPVAKHHGLSGFTGAMKNLYGVLGGRRNRLHQKIDDSIADLADFLRATLTVLDATRVLLRNGPQGGDVSDTREVGRVIVSQDPVAVDAYGCGLIDVAPTALPYLNLADQRGLGTTDLTRIEKHEVS